MPADDDLESLLDRARGRPRRFGMRPPVPEAVLDATLFLLATMVAAGKSEWCREIVANYCDYPALHVSLRDLRSDDVRRWFDAEIVLESGELASYQTRCRALTQIRETLKIVTGAWSLPDAVDDEVRAIVSPGNGLARRDAYDAAAADLADFLAVFRGDDDEN